MGVYIKGMEMPKNCLLYSRNGMDWLDWLKQEAVSDG